VHTLISTFEKDTHEGLSNLFRSFSFVGCIDHTMSLLQHETNLYLVNVCLLSKELIYQQLLLHFGEHDSIRLANAVSLEQLLLIALDSPAGGWTPEDGDKLEIAQACVEILVSKREMLLDYFSIEIDEHNQLCAIPQVIANYVPEMDFLPLFVLRLATEVQWEFEEQCFDTLCREMSEFYMIQSTSYQSEEDVRWIIQHVLFYALKSLEFFPPRVWANDGCIVNIARLENLYKVFERC
jgi:DNA mismatch repair protein MLH1